MPSPLLQRTLKRTLKTCAYQWVDINRGYQSRISIADTYRGYLSRRPTRDSYGRFPVAAPPV